MIHGSPFILKEDIDHEGKLILAGTHLHRDQRFSDDHRAALLTSGKAVATVQVLGRGLDGQNAAVFATAQELKRCLALIEPEALAGNGGQS